MLRKSIMRAIIVSILCMLVAGAWGCAGMLVPKEDQLMPAARYAELETYMESQVKDLHSASTRQLMYLCYSYSRLKKYNKLFPCLEQFDANIAKGDVTVNMFDMSIMPAQLRAEAYIEFGDYGRAATEAQKAYDIVINKDLHRYMSIQALGILGLAQALSGNREKAMECARLLEDIGTHYPFTFLKTDKLNGLSRIYMALGDFQKSLAYIKEDESISSDRAFTQFAVTLVGALPPGDSIFAYSQLPKAFILNKSLYETGNIQEAKVGYDSLLKEPRTRDNKDIYWMILFDRGKITDAEGHRKEAIDFYRRAVDLVEQQRSTINTEASKIGFVGDKQNVYSRLIAALYAEGQYAAAFDYVERSKSRALVDLLASKQDFAVKKGDERDVRNLLDADSKAEAEVIAQDLSPGRSQTRSIIVTVKQELQNKSPELASLVSVTALSASDIRALIPPDEALIEYYYSEGEMFAFVLTREGFKSMRLNSDKLVEDVRQFRTLLETPGSSDYLTLARSLYRRLFAPFEKMLGKKNLAIVPHGALHYLPFNALYNDKGFLIEQYSIRMLPSASVIRYLHARTSSKSPNILAFGNPDLGDPRYDLTYAQQEAQAVARTRPKSRVLLRKEATESAFRNYGRSFRYIHFATHGQFNSDMPLKSALLLAADERSDGRLTVDKIYSMNIDADLVTLSACETGLGKVANGDDVVGLTRGFLYAGSNSIVSSLWKVDDQATGDLMAGFYDALKNAGKREALRQAQLSARKKYPHPYYWASFQLTGSAD
jgi:CHAT domain-containing protein